MVLVASSPPLPPFPPFPPPTAPDRPVRSLLLTSSGTTTGIRTKCCTYSAGDTDRVALRPRPSPALPARACRRQCKQSGFVCLGFYQCRSACVVGLVSTAKYIHGLGHRDRRRRRLSDSTVSCLQSAVCCLVQRSGFWGSRALLSHLKLEP